MALLGGKSCMIKGQIKMCRVGSNLKQMTAFQTSCYLLWKKRLWFTNALHVTVRCCARCHATCSCAFPASACFMWNDAQTLWQPSWATSEPPKGFSKAGATSHEQWQSSAAAGVLNGESQSWWRRHSCPGAQWRSLFSAAGQPCLVPRVWSACSGPRGYFGTWLPDTSLIHKVITVSPVIKWCPFRQLAGGRLVPYVSGKCCGGASSICGLEWNGQEDKTIAQCQLAP